MVINLMDGWSTWAYRWGSVITGNVNKNPERKIPISTDRVDVPLFVGCKEATYHSLVCPTCVNWIRAFVPVRFHMER